MVPDPYRALNIPHSASNEQIKRSYRELARKYHPDRLVSKQATEAEKEQAAAKFAAIASANALLSDPGRKSAYDHIYKYGGYDDAEEDQRKTRLRPYSSGASSAARTRDGNSNNSCPHANADWSQQQQAPSGSRKRKSMGIGYTCYDPLAFLWTQGRVRSTRTVAGVEIPSRIQMMSHAAKAGGSGPSGLRFAFSSGQFAVGPGGSKKYISRTTQFAEGKKSTQTETTILHPDGRREVLIEGIDGKKERTVSTPTRRFHARRQQENMTQPDERSLPWYMHAWSEIKDKFTMCYNPSTGVH